MKKSFYHVVLALFLLTGSSWFGGNAFAQNTQMWEADDGEYHYTVIEVTYPDGRWGWSWLQVQHGTGNYHYEGQNSDGLYVTIDSGNGCYSYWSNEGVSYGHCNYEDGSYYEWSDTPDTSWYIEEYADGSSYESYQYADGSSYEYYQGVFDWMSRRIYTDGSVEEDWGLTAAGLARLSLEELGTIPVAPDP